MPCIGPKKADILQRLVQQKQPQHAVEVGTFCGYSALKIAQVMPSGARVTSFESDWKWALVAKRFVWQATQGSRRQSKPLSAINVQWGDARELLQKTAQQRRQQDRIDLLFIDGMPKQYLDYLKAAEPLLAPGALVIADNAGVFAEGGLKLYLEYVRNGEKYDSRQIETTLEWRDDVKDSIELSEYKG